MQHRTWISIALTTYLLGSCAMSASIDTPPKASPEFAVQLDRANVPLLIRCGGKMYNASAVMVSRHHVLTAKHAVCEGHAVEITGWVEQHETLVEFSVDAVDPLADVARLHTEHELPDVAPRRGPIPKPWSIVCTSVAFPERRVYCGVVDTDVIADAFVSTTGPALPGNSGGGAYNRNGQLVGIVYGYYNKPGDVKNGDAIIELRIGGMMP